MDSRFRNIKYDNDVLMCKNTSRDKHNNICEMYGQIVNVCITSVEESIPMVKTGAQKEETVAGCNEYYKGTIYWHYLCNVEGRPHQGHQYIFYKVY